jgi:hypothetical protein
VAAEAADDTGPALLVLRHEQHPLGPLGGGSRPVLPRFVGLANGILVA